jgi:hypothetical protein
VDVEPQNPIETEYIIGRSSFPGDYSGTEGRLPGEGFVPNPKVAVEIATAVLNEIYGKNNIDKETPFFVNLENGIWIIEGQMETDPNIKGGVAYIEIRKSNGEILKVTHGK